MAFRHLTREMYDALLIAYREVPGNAARAARIANCDSRTARKMWEEGNSKLPWARPIRQALLDEAEAARAAQRKAELAQLDEAKNERDKVRQDAVKALAQEGQMLAAGRANALGVLASLTQLLPSVRKVAQQLNDRIANGDPLEVSQGMKFLDRFTSTFSRAADAADKLIEAERRHKGEPTQVIGLEVEQGTDLEQARETLDEVTSLWALARQRGLVADPKPVGDDDGDERPN